MVAWLRAMAVEEPRSRHIPDILEVESTGITSGLGLCTVRGRIKVDSWVWGLNS